MVLDDLLYDLDFLPNKLDARYKNWGGQGLIVYYIFYNKGSLRDFQSIKDQYQLSDLIFFRFLQIWHHRHTYIPMRKDLFDLPVLNLLWHTMQILSQSNFKTVQRCTGGYEF